MTYDFACDDCKIVTEVDRPVDQAGLAAACPICNCEMRRIFHATPLLGRQKPGSFRWEQGKLNGWDDRIATLRDMESKGPQELRKFKQSIGPLYDMTLKYRKESYA
jgi:putative FmdB family regulatory protein